MLTDLEKSQVRGLIYSPQWKTIEKVAELVIAKIRGDDFAQDSQWGTVSKVLIAEGKTQGISQFMQELLRQTEDVVK